VTGIVISGGSPRVIPENHFRVTPIMVKGWPSIRICFPTTSAAPEGPAPEFVVDYCNLRGCAAAREYIPRGQ
jgi:hypothetical protein